MAAARSKRQRWYVYVLVSSAGRTYVGVSDDVRRRLGQHNGDARGGAKATRAHRPWSVGIVYGPFDTRGAAQSIEHAVKRRRGEARLAFPAKRARLRLTV